MERVCWRAKSSHGLAALRVSLRVLVDAQSVEVFAQNGKVLLSSLVFPLPAATGVQLDSDATVTVRRCQIWPLSSPLARRPADV